MIFATVLTLLFAQIVLADIAPPTKTEMSSLFIGALITTLAFELLTAFIFFKIKEIPQKLLIYVAITNIISLPLFWLAMNALHASSILAVVLGEIAVVIFEALFVFILGRKHISLANSFLLSIIMNAVSVFFGGITYFIFIVRLIWWILSGFSFW